MQLRLRKRFMSRIIEFDTDGHGIHIAKRSPAGDAGLPGPVHIGNQLKNRTVFADKVVAAHASGSVWIGEGGQRRSTALLFGLMDDDQIGLADIEIGRWGYPESLLQG